MSTSYFAFSQFQKRRRWPRSNPTSPVPPQSSLQLSDYPDQPVHTLEPAEEPHPTLKSELSPSEHSLSSPTVHVPSASDKSPTEDAQDPGMSTVSRFSDEYRSPSVVDRPTSSTTSSSSRPSPLTGTPGFSSQYPQKLPAASSPADLHGTPALRTPQSNSSLLYNGRSAARNVSGSSLGSERTFFDDSPSHRNGPSRLGKGRLNLLNPMSLLARRRASQNHLPKLEDVHLSAYSLAVPAMPDDYDPRIRGKIVHDFSAPRPRRIYSHNDVHAEEGVPSIDSRPGTQDGRKMGTDSYSQSVIPSERSFQSPKHSPHFKEHFNDTGPSLQPEATGYLHALAVAAQLHNENDDVKLPAFASRLPSRIRDSDESVERKLPSPTLPRNRSKRISPLASLPMKKVAYFEEPSAEQSPPLAARSSPEPQPTPELDYLKTAPLPKHMTSTSSRFSFQLGGVGSAAQEKLLEEKHKQQMALRQATLKANVEEEDEEDQYAQYDSEDEDGLEERIPGINADADEDDEGELDHGRELNKFHFAAQYALFSPANTQQALQLTPRDEQGHEVGWTESRNSPAQRRSAESRQISPQSLKALSMSLPGPETLPPNHKSSAATEDNSRLSSQPAKSLDGDDMYFDDGNIEAFSDMDGEQEFDEDIFDDETGKIRDIPAQNAKNLDAVKRRVSFDAQTLVSSRGDDSPAGLPPTRERSRRHLSPAMPYSNMPRDFESSDGEHASAETVSTGPKFQTVLSEGNLAAYHNALVSAANEAVAKGRFTRTESTSTSSDDQTSRSLVDRRHAKLVSDDDFSGQNPGRNDIDNNYANDNVAGNLLDDDVDDELMIAEANAEVLENDDEGFYGQEFGFYARAHAKGSSELVNGGYFGPRGVESIHRSHSAKANFQEPSLTPITERSEWSARNSVVSLHFSGFPQSAQSLPSPGIAQLLDVEGSSFDDEMTLSALIKLRRGAWGGSEPSLSSPGGSHTSGSPATHLPPRDFGQLPSGRENSHHMSSSIHSLPGSASILESEEEEGDDEPPSPSLTQKAAKNKIADQTSSTTSMPRGTAVLSLAAPTHPDKAKANRHRRNSSGAESVSYVRDPQGSGRWLLERRRTGDHGELEVIGREYLAEGRI